MYLFLLEDSENDWVLFLAPRSSLPWVSVVRDKWTELSSAGLSLPSYPARPCSAWGGMLLYIALQKDPSSRCPLWNLLPVKKRQSQPGSIPESFLSYKEHPEELGFAKAGSRYKLMGGMSWANNWCFAALLLLNKSPSRFCPVKRDMDS